MDIEMINSNLYGFNELIIEMPTSAQESYNKWIPALTNYTAEMNFHAEKDALEKKQERSLQKCERLLQDYSSIVGNMNMALKRENNKLDSLKEDHNIKQKKDSILKNIITSAIKLGEKNTELNQKKIQLRDSYERVLKKCTFEKGEDQWMMWGKILRLAKMLSVSVSKTIPQKEILGDINNLLDKYLEYNKDKDPTAKQYVPAAKEYYKLVSQKELEPVGILMIGTENNAPHPVLKIGDIVIERKGKSIYRVDDYAKLKEDPSPNVVKIIRFTANGKKSEKTQTIPDSKVLVGFINLWEEK
jgi:hypothetical protein